MTDSINPSMNTQINSSPIRYDLDVSNQYAAHKQEEQDHMAPKILPGTMETAILNLTGKIYMDLLEIRKVIATTEANHKMKAAPIKAIYKLIDDVNEAIIIKIPQELDKLAL